eukprot:4519781-Pyramimonas_sp.AAC.1
MAPAGRQRGASGGWTRWRTRSGSGCDWSSTTAVPTTGLATTMTMTGRQLTLRGIRSARRGIGGTLPRATRSRTWVGCPLDRRRWRRRRR